MVRLLGLSGSLRRASNSTAVLRGLQDALAPRAALDIFPLHGTPLYRWRARTGIGADAAFGHRDERWRDHDLARVQSRHVRRPEERARLGLAAFWTLGAKGQAGTDDDGLARLHRRVRAQQHMNETLASIPARHVLRPQIVIGGVYEKVRDGRDDLLDDIRAARFLRAVSFRILFVPSRTSAESL